jgi:cytochrome P450
MKHPEAYRKLREEIDTATTNGELSSPHIVYNEAAKLPYLHACIKEGMRMNPGVGSSLPRHVPKGGREIAGHFFREGLKVGVNALTIQYNTTIFGDDAHEFKPERWFRENAVDMDRHMFLVSKQPQPGWNLAKTDWT